MQFNMDGFATLADNSFRKSRVTVEVLPDHLIWNIMAHLPMGSLLRLCSVCKKWNCFLKDPLFQKLWASVHGGEHFLFYHEFITHLSRNRKQYSATVSGGFLRLNYLDDIYVVDPANLYLKKIPSPCCKLKDIPGRLYYVGMVVTPGTKDYRIFAEYRAHIKRKTVSSIYEYHPTKDAWHLSRRLPSELVDGDRSLERVVTREGSLYFLMKFRVYIRGGGRKQCFRVAHYEERSRCWEELTAGIPPLVPFPESPPLLFEHRGKLFLAAICDTFPGYCIWQYNDNAAEWNLLERFSVEFTGFVGFQNMSFRAQLCGDVLHVTKRQRRGNELPSVMTYNLVTRQFKEMLADEVERKLVRVWAQNNFFFQPIL